jgi:hypothetical protein
MEGDGLTGFTFVDSASYSKARGYASASMILPFLSGTGQLIARAYHDRTMATVIVQPIFLIIVLAFILLLGIMAAIFTPTLPQGVPRRGFDVYSWIALLFGDGLIQDVQDLKFERDMDLRELKRQTKNWKVKYMID